MAHAQIVLKLGAAIQRRLRAGGPPCRTFIDSMKLRTDRSLFCPDLIVPCGLLDRRQQEIADPAVLGEVLSESTEDLNRGLKWRDYQRLPSLHHYLLVEQAEPAVEIYSRTDIGWHFRRIEGLTEQVPLEAIGVELPLAEIFADVFAA